MAWCKSESTQDTHTTATRCITLHHTASHCCTLQHAATGGVVQVGIKRRGAARAHDSHMIVVLARSLPSDSTSIYPPNGLPPSSPTKREPEEIRKVAKSDQMQCVAVCCSVLQCVAVCCSVLQCAAARCSVLHCVVPCALDRLLQPVLSESASSLFWSTFSSNF